MAIRYFGQYTVRKQRKHSKIGRFLEKILVNPDKVFEGTPCWEWHGASNHDGYGRFFGLKETYAHRYSHRYFIGDIPEGHEIDHRCRNRRCQSPFHIQTVTHSANHALRTDIKTHCINGHPYNKENTRYTNRGGRLCKVCRYAAIKRWRENNPEEARVIGRESKSSWRGKQRDAGRTGRY